MSVSDVVNSLYSGKPAGSRALLSAATAEIMGTTKSSPTLTGNPEKPSSSTSSGSKSATDLCVGTQKDNREVIMSDSQNSFHVVVSGAWESCESDLDDVNKSNKDGGRQRDGRPILGLRRHSLATAAFKASKTKTIAGTKKVSDFFSTHISSNIVSDNEKPSCSNTATGTEDTTRKRKRLSDSAIQSTGNRGSDNIGCQTDDSHCSKNSKNKGSDRIALADEKLYKSHATQTPKTKGDWARLETCIDTFSSTCFQSWEEKEESIVLPAARDFWRDIRSQNDLNLRQTIRADELDELLDEDILPAWAYGWGPLPRYLGKCPEKLISLRQAQARAVVETLKEHLTEEGEIALVKAQAYKKMVSDIYENHNKDEKYDLQEALDKSKEIVARDFRRYTRDTAMHTAVVKSLPRLGESEIAKISLKGPAAFSQLLSHFDAGKKQDSSDNEAKPRPGPYQKGRGPQRANNNKKNKYNNKRRF